MFDIVLCVMGRALSETCRSVRNPFLGWCQTMNESLTLSFVKTNLFSCGEIQTSFLKSKFVRPKVVNGSVQSRLTDCD